MVIYTQRIMLCLPRLLASENSSQKDRASDISHEDGKS